MYQRARAEKSEVQNLIYGDGRAQDKNYMRQNYEELQQIQRETQQKITQAQQPKEDRWVMKKFRDVKPKLARTGMMNDENSKAEGSYQREEQPRSRTQDKTRAQPPSSKLTKAEKFKMMKQGNNPLNEQNPNSKPAAPLRRSTLQSAGKDMINSKPPKAAYKPPKREQPPMQTSTRVGSCNPPPPEQPNVVYYTPDSKEDIFALGGPPVDPVKEHRDKYIPRNMPVAKNKRVTKSDHFEEAKVTKKESIPTQKGYIAPKKAKNFVKANYIEAADENTMAVKARGTVNKQDQQSASNKNYGKVPKYLKKYNAEREMKEELKRQMEADKDVPAGCKRMEESERLATLRDLENNKREVNTMLEKLPISMRTQALNKRRSELEEKLAEIDRAIAMFSKKVVYVAL